MKIKHILSTLLITGVLFNATPNTSHAEYITAFEDIKYEKYVVDTDSLYFPDPKHKLDQFNCVVWFYTSATDKGTSYTFRYKFDKNEWKLAEHDSKTDKLVWETFEDTSPAANVLRVVIPFIGHTAIDKNNNEKH